MGLEKINEYKKRIGLTTEELSKLSGVPVGTLNKILSGATKDPKLETLKAIARVLGLTLNDFDDIPYSSTIAAHFDGDEYTEDELKEIQNYAEFIKCKRNETKQSKLSQLPDRSYLEPDAAHERTDIPKESRTNELQQMEDDIMDEKNF